MDAQRTTIASLETTPERPRLVPTPIKARTLTGLFRKVTFAHVYGEDLTSKKGRLGPKQVRPSYGKDLFRIVYNNEGPRKIRRWSNRDFGRHLTEQETLYFMGNPAKSADYTLVLIDVDCHGGESGASEAKRVISGAIPQVAWEPKGNAFHGYLLLYKPWVDARAVNRMLKGRLEPLLRRLAQGLDISGVEVKGTLPELEYEQKMLACVKYGTFGKFPRSLSVYDLKKATISYDDLHDLTAEHTPSSESCRTRSSGRENTKARETELCGSVSGKFVPDEHLAALPVLEKYAEQLLDGEVLSCSGTRGKVSNRDVSFGLLLLYFFRSNPNPDKSMPRARAEAMWKGIVRSGDFDRGWHPGKWTAITRMLMDRRWVDWFDHEFEPGARGKKGVAAKWQICQEIFEQVGRILAKNSETNPRGASFGTTSDCLSNRLPSPSAGQYRPKISAGKSKPWLRLLEHAVVHVDDILRLLAA